MMFHENLKAIRRAKGLTQEELATRLHVVRQTVSKWEKGQSVPDADMLIKIAEVFEVSVSELLGRAAKTEQEPDVNAIASQLVRINEQLAVRNRRSRRIARIVLGVIAAFILFQLLLGILSLMNYTYEPTIGSTEIVSTDD